MSKPGWYPDPGGEPGRFRFWDGESWSAGTTDDPASSTSPAAKPARRNRAWIIAVAVGLAVIIIAAIAIPALFASRRVVDGAPTPSATVASDPATETPSALQPTPEPSESPVGPTPSSADPSASPTSDGSTPAAGVCPLGDPSFRQDHPRDGRIHGGGLSFPRSDAFGPTQQQGYFSWAYDVAGQDRRVEATWISSYIVGALPTFEGFESPKQSASLVLACTVRSPLYTGLTGQTQLASRKITVDGQPGWALRTEIRVDNPAVSVAGDVVEIIVVDTGSPESLSMFWASVPIGDSAALTQLQTTIGRLKAE